MNGPKLIETLRQDILLDNAKPYLWRDEALYRMLSLGQRSFSEDTHCLEDVVEIVTEPDVATYPLEGTTLRVKAVGLSEQGPWLSPAVCNGSLGAKGSPIYYITNNTDGEITFLPTPDKAATLFVYRSRLPHYDISDTQGPEVPERHHEALLHFAAWRALITNDPDGNHNASAANHEKLYLQAVRDAKRRYYHFRMNNDPRISNPAVRR